MNHTLKDKILEETIITDPIEYVELLLKTKMRNTSTEDDEYFYLEKTEDFFINSHVYNTPKPIPTITPPPLKMKPKISKIDTMLAHQMKKIMLAQGITLVNNPNPKRTLSFPIDKTKVCSVVK